jgi:hypothetical protein
MDVTVKGLAIEDFGLSAENTISGLGLCTFGLVWGCHDIWGPVIDEPTTTWTDAEPVVNVESC